MSQRPLYHVKIGMPVYDFKMTEIWAFWNEDRTFTSPMFKFATRSQLLGDARVRETEVHFDDTSWFASPDCIQRDFAETPFFFMNPLAGPQAKLAALRLLLADQDFCRYCSDSVEALKSYEIRASNQAVTPWF